MSSKSVNQYGSIYKDSFYIIWAELVENLKNVFRFLSVSSLFVGITGFFQTFTGYLLLGVPPNIQICSAVFLMAFGLYSLNKITDIKEDAINMPERVNFLRGRRNLAIAYSIVAYLLCILLTFLDNPSSIVVVFVPFIANALYGSRLIPGLPRLKDIPVMKNVIVAVSWALTTTLLPAAHIMSEKFTVALILYFMLVKAFVNTALYDVRDVKGDRENKIRTIPVIVGPKKTILILLAINATLLPLLIFLDNNARLLAASLIISGFACIFYFGMKKNPLAMDLFVDGEWMLTCVIFILLKIVRLLP